MGLIPKAIEKRLTPKMIEQLERLITGDAEYKCKTSTGNTIRLLVELFPGSEADCSRAANTIKSLLGDTASKPTPMYKHTELSEAILLADTAIKDTSFFYNERPKPSILAYSIAVWTKFGEMRERYEKHRHEYEMKMVKDATNRFKRPESAIGYSLLQKLPIATREKIEGRINEMIERTKEAFGESYVERNYVRLVSDWLNQERIYDPLTRVTPSGEKFCAIYV